MPIYEFGCPKCRVIFSFLSKRLNPDRLPACPKCGNRKMEKQLSHFATPKAAGKSEGNEGDTEAGPGEAMPDMDDPRIQRAMGELERDMDHMDENNPKHMAHFMRKMKDMMPPGALPKDIDIAIKRLEAGEDPEKIEEDMGELFGELGAEGQGGGTGGYAKDSGLYDY
ncbi:MAG: cytochrome [Verrucomicrobiales bacterium]|nr:cytochrome [Verrucomicrobiales bacterium]